MFAVFKPQNKKIFPLERVIKWGYNKYPILTFSFLKAFVMRTSTSLCFSREGLVNPKAVNYLQNREIDTVVFFCDGSQEAYQHLQSFDVASLPDHITKYAIGKLPLYDMRVISFDGSVSEPQYVNSDELKMKWICSRICPHLLQLSIRDITSQSTTETILDRSQTETVCWLAHQFWSVLLEAESRLCFPAVVIDRLSRFTYSLTPQTIDLPALRLDTGLETLEYNHLSDQLTITVSDDLFSVKMSVLNAFYGEFILPRFNEIFGRRLRIKAQVIGSTGKFSEPQDVSYGELGRLVEEMKLYAQEKMITADHPMTGHDLLSFAKKVKINDESCLWPAAGQTISDFVIASHDQLVRRPLVDDIRSEESDQETADHLVGEHSQ